METIRSLLADPAFWGIVSAVSAFLAVPIAVLALLSSHRTARRMVEIEEARDLSADRQASKAALVTDWEPLYYQSNPGPVPYGYCLTVANQGVGPARRIYVAIDGEDVTDKAKAPRDPDGKVSRLDPDALFKITIDRMNYFGYPKYRVRVEWEDGSGEPGLYESDL